MTKKYIVPALFATALTITQLAYAENISNYADMVATLKSGHKIFALIDVEKCKFAPGKTNLWEEKTRSMQINEIYERVTTELNGGHKMRVVATAEHGLSGRTDFHLTRTLLRIFENGAVELLDFEINPQTYKLADENVLFCHLSADGSGGVTLTSKK